MLQGHAAAAADVLGIAVRGANGGVFRLTTIDPQVHRSLCGRCIAAHIAQQAVREGSAKRLPGRRKRTRRTSQRGEVKTLVWCSLLLLRVAIKPVAMRAADACC